MSVIKKVMVFVMGVVVIGVVSTTIGVVTQPKTIEKSVTFELLENNELAFNVYDAIIENAIFEGEFAINLVDFRINSDVITNPALFYVTDMIVIRDDTDDDPTINIDTDFYDVEIGYLEVGDVITITFEVEQETPVIIRTLLLLMPLVLSASLIGYLSLSVKKGDE